VEVAVDRANPEFFVEGATRVAIYCLFLNLKYIFKNYSINITVA
jgi:hypothetical protein